MIGLSFASKNPDSESRIKNQESRIPHRRRLAIDRREKIVDVVPLEHPLAERLERDTLLALIPFGAQVLKLPFVLVAPTLDRLACRDQTLAQRRRINAAFTQLADLVELLVEGKDL